MNNIDRRLARAERQAEREAIDALGKRLAEWAGDRAPAPLARPRRRLTDGEREARRAERAARVRRIDARHIDGLVTFGGRLPYVEAAPKLLPDPARWTAPPLPAPPPGPVDVEPYRPRYKATNDDERPLRSVPPERPCHGKVDPRTGAKLI